MKKPKPNLKPPKLPEWEMAVQVQAIMTGSFFDRAETREEAIERVKETIRCGGTKHLHIEITDISVEAKPDPADEVPW